MNIIIRLLEERDIDACAAIVGANYSEEYRKPSRDEIASMFSNAAIKPTYWVAESNKEVVGFGGYVQSWMDYGVYQIFWVNVPAQFQRRGIGRLLVNKLISEIRNKPESDLIQLTATEKNATYYRKHLGFVRSIRINKTPEYLMYMKL